MQGLHPKDVFADRYRLMKWVAEDLFSESWMVNNEKVGNKQVLKVYHSLEEKGCKAFRREFERAYHLTYARLVRVTYFDVYNSRPYLLLPHFRRGSTARLAGKLSEKEIARIMRDIGGALAFLHQPAYNIIHRGVHPDNILLDDQGHYMLNIFGISAELQEVFNSQAKERGLAVASHESGPLQAYQPPELFRGVDKNNATFASDVWALGATLFELAAGEPPFGQLGGKGQLSGQSAPDLPSHFSRTLNNILKKCMSEALRNRPAAETLRTVAEVYLDTGQWAVLPSGNSGQSSIQNRLAGMHTRSIERAGTAIADRLAFSPGRIGAAVTRMLERIPKPSVSRIGDALYGRMAKTWKPYYQRTGAALLLVLFVALGLALAWPKFKARNGLAGNEVAVQSTSTHQPINQKPSKENYGPDKVELEKKAVNNPDSNPPAEVSEDKDVPDNIYTFPPVVPAQREAQQSSKLQPKPPAEGRNKAEAGPVSTPEKTVREAITEEKPATPGPETGARQQWAKPQFNSLTKKWGYIDNLGTWVIWPQFEEALPFKDGKAIVVREINNGELKSYYLDTNGYLTPIAETDAASNENN